MTTPQSIIYYRGESLWFGCEVLDDEGAPANLLAVEAACTAEHKEGGETRALELVWVDRAAGRFEFWALGDGLAADWRTGSWEARIVYTRAGGGPGGRPLVLGTETMNLLIKKAP